MEDSSQDIELPKNFDIEDVSTSSDETAIEAGKVETWKFLELTERAKWRSYITGTIVTLWAVCTLVGLFRWVVVGDTLLLISAPAWFLGPLGRILKYYFRG